jgi:hypothetical protein
MYVAEGNQIFYVYPDETGRRELFITVHPTQSNGITPDHQAGIIAEILNRIA